ncbi:MAG: hypothetical protein H6709_21280 [Kofleriaceae bacterium]|nr:hypothetical protein [Kofleriaceae bacterium]MCB9574617.1 hypothetical protein [Kofleriaceae bacterium]
MRHLVLLVAVTAIAALGSACAVNDYCIDCFDGDGGVIDGPRRDATIDANDGGAGADACIPTGDEICNGLDDDCDGSTDEDAAQVGNSCGTDVGQCTTGVFECNAGVLRCTGVPASAEECDDIDNDCDGVVDNGNPEGGESCGTDVGECVAGVTMCLPGGVLDCVGDVGTVGGDPEICDGKDNDCDGMFDEGIPSAGPCGNGTGECTEGQLLCVGGTTQCVGGTGPTLELCDNLDHDCDGNNTNGFDLAGDVRNCGSCGNSCVGTLDNATERCSGGSCAVASCDPGFFDNDGLPGNGCEYGPCTYNGPVDTCNLVDDDCDGVVDEDISAAPPICATLGACAGTVATCVAGGWDCQYTGDVSVDANGDLIPENQCDGVDNDCDGRTDESHPSLGQACADNGLGVCQGTGTKQCNAADETGPTVCVITTPGQAPGTEVCDGLDNDCNGTTDDGALTGDLQDWVSIGGGHEIMQYEASRPDARAATSGSNNAYVCSRQGVMPWTFVTEPEAEAACEAVGARLCTEQEWHRACAVVTPTTFPLVEPAANNGKIFVEAEDYYAITTGVSGGTDRAWVPDYTAGYSGISALRASPNTGANLNATTALTDGPTLQYQIDFTSAGTHYVWLRMYSPTGSDDTAYVSIDSSSSGMVHAVTATNNGWVWERYQFNGITVGTHLLTVYMDEDGLKLDALIVTRSNSTTDPTDTTGPGGTWAFASNPDTYVTTTCNGHDLDPASDAILPTGSVPSGQCYANQPAGHVYDLSGNVKEWTAPRQIGNNPIRGGASNNTATGISCSLAFTLADDSFFFSNVGFRCCRDVP